MPKNKTRSSAKKRYTVTGSGKLMHQRTKLRHKLEHKSSRQTRRLTGKIESAKVDAPRIRKMLGR